MLSLAIRPAAFTLPALWRTAAPAGERAELSIAARIFTRATDEPYVGRHRKQQRVWARPIRFADIDNEAYAEAMA